MTIVIRRPVGVLVGLSAAALLLTACSSGPSQVGQAVIVGNTSVSVDQVQQELDDLLSSQAAVRQAQQQGKLDQASRAIVTTHVLHVLVTRAAAQDRLTVSDQQLDQLIAQAGGLAKVSQGLGTDTPETRQTVKDLLLEVQLARKFADTLSVNFGYVVATTRAEALSDAQQIAANPASLNGLVQKANAAAQASGQSGGAGALTQSFSVATYLQNTAEQQQEAQSQGQTAPVVNESPLFGTPANTVVAFQPDAADNSGWIVALIKSRNQNGKPAAGAPSSADSSDTQTLSQVGISLMEPEVNQVGGVRVSPRYGVWDPVGMQVVANSNETLGVEFPVQRKQQ